MFAHSSRRARARPDLRAEVRAISRAQVRSARLLALLNFGQVTIFSCGLGSMLSMAASAGGRRAGAAGAAGASLLSVGEIAALNALLLQLVMPFNFIGYTFQARARRLRAPVLSRAAGPAGCLGHTSVCRGGPAGDGREGSVTSAHPSGVNRRRMR